MDKSFHHANLRNPIAGIKMFFLISVLCANTAEASFYSDVNNNDSRNDQFEVCAESSVELFSKTPHSIVETISFEIKGSDTISGIELFVDGSFFRSIYANRDSLAYNFPIQQKFNSIEFRNNSNTPVTILNLRTGALQPRPSPSPSPQNEIYEQRNEIVRTAATAIRQHFIQFRELLKDINSLVSPQLARKYTGELSDINNQALVLTATSDAEFIRKSQQFTRELEQKISNLLQRTAEQLFISEHNQKSLAQYQGIFHKISQLKEGDIIPALKDLQRAQGGQVAPPTPMPPPSSEHHYGKEYPRNIPFVDPFKTTYPEFSQGYAQIAEISKKVAAIVSDKVAAEIFSELKRTAGMAVSIPFDQNNRNREQARKFANEISSMIKAILSKENLKHWLNNDDVERLLKVQASMAELGKK